MSKYEDVIVSSFEEYYDLVKEGKPMSTIVFKDEDMYKDFLSYLEKYDDDLTTDLIKAEIYLKGLGVDVDKDKAFHYALLSSEKMDVRGLNLLANCHYSGIGTPKNLDNALACYQMAASKDYALAYYNLWYFYVEAGYPYTNYYIAPMYLEKAAELGDPTSTFYLGIIYFTGMGVAQSYEMAAYWYLKAAEFGDKYVDINLGFMYENGFGVEASYDQAGKWYQKAASNGNIEAMYKYALCLYNTKKHDEAFTHFMIAAKKDNPDAQGWVAKCYLEESGVKRIDSEVYYWANLAARNDSCLGQSILSECYKTGIGIKRDKEKAKYWDFVYEHNLHKKANKNNRVS